MINALILGIVQGLTEFLPVSSDGHLFLLKRLLNIHGDFLPFVVFLHTATLLAILWFFRAEIKTLLSDKKSLVFILVATVITAVIGVLLKKFLLSGIEDNKYFLSAGFLFTAAILFIAKTDGKRSTSAQIGWFEAIVAGIMQGIAVLPGVSRSGMTIGSLLKCGFAPKDAFTFSFLLGIPAIAGAFLLEAKDVFQAAPGAPGSLNAMLSQFSLPSFILSFTAAFIFGILALKLLRSSLVTGNFKKFGYYCLVIGAINLFL